jgi:hypothetical protein
MQRWKSINEDQLQRMQRLQCFLTRERVEESNKDTTKLNADRSKKEASVEKCCCIR